MACFLEYPMMQLYLLQVKLSLSGGVRAKASLAAMWTVEAGARGAPISLFWDTMQEAKLGWPQRGHASCRVTESMLGPLQGGCASGPAELLRAVRQPGVLKLDMHCAG